MCKAIRAVSGRETERERERERDRERDPKNDFKERAIRRVRHRLLGLHLTDVIRFGLRSQNWLLSTYLDKSYQAG
jgi:hypothetical protein